MQYRLLTTRLHILHEGTTVRTQYTHNSADWRQSYQRTVNVEQQMHA